MIFFALFGILSFICIVSAYLGFFSPFFVFLFFWAARLSSIWMPLIIIICSVFFSWIVFAKLEIYLFTTYGFYAIVQSDFIGIAKRRFYEQLLMLALFLIPILLYLSKHFFIDFIIGLTLFPLIYKYSYPYYRNYIIKNQMSR
jgi:hypothetical protein